MRVVLRAIQLKIFSIAYVHQLKRQLAKERKVKED